MADKNIGASVRSKLKNIAQAENKVFNFILTRYALERFLYRLSVQIIEITFCSKELCYLICGSLVVLAPQSRIWI